MTKPTKALCPRTLRYVARRMRAYWRHYDAAEHSSNVDAAFAAGLARMAKKAADECIGTAGDIESRATKPRKLTPATTLCGPVPRTPKRKAKR
jgi:hypothetical protein